MNMSDIRAIVYMSNAGHTRRYAELMGERTGLVVCELKQSKKVLPKGSRIIYMGWLLGGSIKGYKEACARYDVKAVCAVGMAANGSQMNDIHKMNSIKEGTEVFTLQGGFDKQSLHGIYKMMMNFASKGAKKALSAKQQLSDEDREMLAMFADGKDTVSEENLQVVLDWYKGYAKQ